MTETTDDRLNSRELLALRDAAKNPNGWGLYLPKTTEKLAARGYFARELHPAYGLRWRITEAGRKVLKP